MGVDITLGVLILLCAVRGWLRGFLRQAIPLGSLVAGIYLSDPLRELARPHARKSFPSIGPEIMDRLLWWSCAAGSYLVLAGVGLSILRSMKKRTYGDPEPNRADQGAGFTLGALKGAILASFIAWGISESRTTYLAATPFVEKQAKESKALVWSDQYKPARTLWTSIPVQSLVNRVKSRGLWLDQTPASPTDPALSKIETAKPEASVAPPLRTAQARPKTLSLPRLDPESPDFLRKLDEALKREGLKPE